MTVFEKLIKTQDHKRLYENILSLYVLQGLNYLLPFITLPYLVRVLGPQKYGLVMFAQAVIMYFVVFTDFGFNLSGTRDIARAKMDQEQISGVFSSIVLAKIALMTLSFVALLLLILSVDKFRANWVLYLISFGIVAGNVALPIWFFQGMEKMKHVTALNVVAKLIFTIGIFVFIKDSSDYLGVPLLNSIGFIAAGMLSFYMAFKMFNVQFRLEPFSRLLSQFKGSYQIFFSSVAIILFGATSTVILGMIGTNRDVAIFTGAERIICAVYSLVIPIVNAVYPYLSSKASDNFPLLLRMFNRLFLFIVGGFTFVSVVAFFSSSFLVKLVLGSEFMASVEVLRILSFLPLIVAINTAINVLLLLPMNLDHLRTAIIAIGGVANLFLCILLTKKFSFIGTSISYVVSQFLVAVISIGVYIKLRVKYQDQA